MHTKFEDLGLSTQQVDVIKKIGYLEPTPIQGMAIPLALDGHDILGCAQTGTGKTASFILPIIERLAIGRSRARMPRSLVLAPTRELAIQIGENFDLYCQHVNLSKALLIGGTDITKQMRLINQGVDVLIATPGRLLDVFERGGIMLADIKILVIDEADRMLNMGFIPDIKKIIKLLPQHRQTLFFSATIAPEILSITKQFLTNPKEVNVTPDVSLSDNVEHFIIKVPENRKRKFIRDLITRNNFTSTFIFCNRKTSVNELHSSLIKHKFNAGATHGDMDQATRNDILQKFKQEEINILVASDVAARGIDVKNISHVINFDLPSNSEDYVHRIGRTGRAQKKGLAYSLCSKNDQKNLEAIEKLIGYKIKEYTLETDHNEEGKAAPKAESKAAAPKAESRAAAPKAESKAAPKAESRAIAPKAESKAAPKAESRASAPKTESRAAAPDALNTLPDFITVGPDWLTILRKSILKKNSK